MGWVEHNFSTPTQFEQNKKTKIFNSTLSGYSSWTYNPSLDYMKVIFKWYWYYRRWAGRKKENMKKKYIYTQEKLEEELKKFGREDE